MASWDIAGLFLLGTSALDHSTTRRFYEHRFCAAGDPSSSRRQSVVLCPGRRRCWLCIAIQDHVCIGRGCGIPLAAVSEEMETPPHFLRDGGADLAGSVHPHSDARTAYAPECFCDAFDDSGLFHGRPLFVTADQGALTFAESTLLAVQAGGNINYFFESLFAITPFAAAGVLWVRDNLDVRVSVLVGLLIWGLGIDPLIPATVEAAHVGKDVKAQNRYIQNLRSELAGKNVFSTAGWVSHLTERVALPEPYLLSYLERGAKWDSGVWAAGIYRRDYDLVVTDLPQITFRTVPHVPPKIHIAIEEAYEPFCACPGILLFRRQGEKLEAGTVAQFAAIGCHTVVCPADAECRAW
jgi:hypothetical protein